MVKVTVNQIKLKAGCKDCGYRDNPMALQFDHRDPSQKKFNIGGRNAGLKHILEEIAKCDVRCANCHIIRTLSGGNP